MTKLKSLLIAASIAFFFLMSSSSLVAQCSVNEVELTMILNTDAWGYEVYWELYLEGETCGLDPILSGGNSAQVGCDGAGDQDATGGNGYPSNTTIDVGPICVEEGQTLVLQFIDDWGDGGLSFQIYEDGQFITTFVGSGSGNTWTFTPGEFEFPENNIPCGAIELVVDGDIEVWNNETANVYPGEPAPAGGGCQLPGLWCEGGLSNTLWGSFVAPESGAVYVSTCHASTPIDTQLALYRADDCGDFSTFELLAAGDDVIGGCGPGNGFASDLYAGCLVPGTTYFIQMDGYNGATGNFGITVESYDEAPALTGNTNNIACAVGKGESGDGSIYPYFIGYGSNFDASWSGPNGFSSGSAGINDLDPGEYTLTATTECGEEYVQTYTITAPAPLSLTINLEQPSCPTSGDGEAVVSVNGGTGPFTFEWEGEGYASTDAAPDDLNEGGYQLTVTDNNDCEITQQIQVASLNDIPLDLGPNQTICANENTLVFGPAGYEYLWQDGSVNQFFFVEGENYETGTYNFILTAFNDEGCEATDAVSITIEDCTSVEESNWSNFSMYPNPANEVLYLNGLPAGSKELRLYTLTGSLVEATSVQGITAQVSCSNHAPGTYILSIEHGGNVRYERLMIR